MCVYNGNNKSFIWILKIKLTNNMFNKVPNLIVEKMYNMKKYKYS